MQSFRLRAVVLAAALAAAVLPAAATAATPAPSAKPVVVKGVVVAREGARGTLVVAQSGGVVRTLRTTAARRVGSRVVAKATRLADGTFAAVKVSGKHVARKARVRAVVIRSVGGRIMLSAGGSVFSIGAGRHTAAVGASSDLTPGTAVDTTVSIDPSSGSVEQETLKQVGQTGLVSLEGTISSLSATMLVLDVEEGATTTVAIPSSLALPSTIAVGDHVEVLVQVAAGAFTLVTIQDDHAAQHGDGTDMSSSTVQHGHGSEHNGGKVEAEGTVTAVGSGSLTIQGEHASAITFVVPAGFTLPAVQAGTQVHAKGMLAAGGTITLVRLEVQNAHEHGDQGDQGQQGQQGQQGDHGDHSGVVEAEGAVTAFDAHSVTVQPQDGGDPVVFTIPAGLEVPTLAVGDTVSVRAERASDGTLVLTRIEAQTASKDESASGSTGDSGSGGGTGGDG